ncbi:MAG: MFS transporter [Hyphococcus sp.]|nr:MAG: MFS transporter [Marinicaulis sp.]
MEKPALSRRFVTLASGEAASLFGDQFTHIAAIWLILSITDNAAAVGLWLAVGAIPNALFILIGGAMVDRFDPRRMMIVSNLLRAGLTLGLAAMAATGSITMPILYGFAAAFGAAGAFYLPAITALTPRLVPERSLHVGNSVVQGLMYLANLAGPPLAAVLLAYFLSEAFPAAAYFKTAPQSAYAALFSIDALTFLISLWTLTIIGKGMGDDKGASSQASESPFHSIGQGLKFAARDKRLRSFLMVAIVANFFLAGPIAVGMPLLAKFTLSDSVIALGVISSASALGGLFGLVCAGVTPALSNNKLFALPFIALPLLSLLLAGLGFVGDLKSVALLMGALVAGAAFVDVQVMTWLQKTVDEEFLGRVVSILQFGALGMAPLSMALVGMLAGALDNQVSGMFIGFGGALFVASILLAMNVRRSD